MTAGRTRRLGIQGKAVLGLLAVALVPLLVALLLVYQITEASARVAAGEAERLRTRFAASANAYKEAVAATKQAFRARAALAATSPRLAQLCSARAPDEETRAALADLFDPELSLGRAALVDGGVERTFVERPWPEPVRTLELEQPLTGASFCSLRLTFGFRARLLDEQQALGEALREHRYLERVSSTLPRSYWLAFASLFGGVVAAVTVLAIFWARRTSRRIEQLVDATRRVADGDLESRVEVPGRDELADLARAFNAMIDDIHRSRAEIEYLQKIGAWQEVARRLAHEIKNPLTPIQLAVQQLSSKYGGEDARFRKMLDDASEIVTEEVGGLRRLVDAFSSFAKLPRVEPRPLDLAAVVDDVQREAVEPFEIDAPPAPVWVAGDRLLLRRALSNLVQNAREAGATRVRVRWRAGAGEARLDVDDDGPGVPDELRDRVFDPYVTGKEHGTGLGLAIVKKTLLEHGGDVVLARGEGELGGARFEARLPLAEAPGVAA